MCRVYLHCCNHFIKKKNSLLHGLPGKNAVIWDSTLESNVSWILSCDWQNWILEFVSSQSNVHLHAPSLSFWPLLTAGRVCFTGLCTARDSLLHVHQGNYTRLATHYFPSTREFIHGSRLIITRPPGKLYTARDSLLHVHQGIYTRLATHYFPSTRETIHGSQLIISRPPGNLYTARNSLLHVHKGIYTRLATHYLPSSREILHGLHLIITGPPGRLYTARNSLFPIHQGIFTRLATFINIKWTRLVQSTTIL